VTEFSSETESLDERSSQGVLHLLILLGKSPRTEVLPVVGTVCVGRSEQADVQLDEPAVSRRHFNLHINSSVVLEDLGSANGTVVRGRKVPSGRRVNVRPGDTIEIGRALLVLQRSKILPVDGIPLRSHEYFQERLDEECRRGGDRAFGLFRVRTRPGLGQELLRRMAEMLTSSVIAVGEFGPDDYEVLVLGSEPDPGALFGILSVGGLGFGLAWFPRDGRSAAELLERASTRLQSSTQPRNAPAGRKGTETSGQWGVGSSRGAGGFLEQLEPVLDRIAPTRLSVLLVGETGVGKGVLAEEIHRRSNRSEGPFIPLHCAEFPESLLEGELFGYERAAFTGAAQAKTGLVEAADGGTLFLDEVAEIPRAVQVKLLRVLENGEVRRLGSVKPRKIDIRLVSASGKDLEQECAKGTFGPDLYFRLNGLTLWIPPLRERTQEIEALAHKFIAEFSANLGVAAPAVLSPEALEALRSHPWDGNIRELRNAMERAVALCTEGVITRRHLPSGRTRLIPRPVPRQEPSVPPPEADERSRIAAALESCGGNQSKAAKLLGMSRRTLVTKLEKYGFPRPIGRRS
jgi:DNA-binding NtrC family response regulator